METMESSTSSHRSSSVPQIDWVMNQYYFEEDKKNKTSKFMGLSLTAHIVALLAIVYITIPLLQKPDVETITIEIADSEPSYVHHKAIPMPEPAVLDEAPVIEKERAAPVVARQEEIRVQARPVAKAVAQQRAPKIAAVSATLDDIQTEDLNLASAKQNSASNMNPQVFDQDLENDLLAINQQHKKSIEQAQNRMRQQLDDEDQENQNKLAAIENENAKKRERLAQASAERRKAEAASLAALQAQEEAEQAAAAEKAEMAAKAQERANAEAARQATARQQADLAKAAEQRRQNLSTAKAARDRENGSGGGVRSLAELKQMPGNPRPQYDPNERLKGQRGQVTFLAYITKEGNISKLKTVALSGFENLDRKSLEAVKKWKFYPGQEGWVEIPFSWDLKGDTQEMPSLLRRSFSQR